MTRGHCYCNKPTEKIITENVWQSKKSIAHSINNLLSNNGHQKKINKKKLKKHIRKAKSFLKIMYDVKKLQWFLYEVNSLVQGFR